MRARIPNPYWEPTLRKLTGRDAEVVRFLEAQEAAGRLIEDIARFIEARIPEYQAQQSRLSHGRGRLHGRAASLGVHRRSARASALRERFPNVVSARHSALCPR